MKFNDFEILLTDVFLKSSKAAIYDLVKKDNKYKIRTGG